MLHLELSFRPKERRECSRRSALHEEPVSYHHAPGRSRILPVGLMARTPQNPRKYQISTEQERLLKTWSYRLVCSIPITQEPVFQIPRAFWEVVGFVVKVARLVVFGFIVFQFPGFCSHQVLYCALALKYTGMMNWRGCYWKKGFKPDRASPIVSTADCPSVSIIDWAGEPNLKTSLSLSTSSSCQSLISKISGHKKSPQLTFIIR